MVFDPDSGSLRGRIVRWLTIVTMACTTGCASVTPPDGGTRDTVAPNIISSIPATGAVNVTGQQITLLFDEPVTTEQLVNQLVVSPATDVGSPKIKERNNIISLEFPKPFSPNTTYLLDFGQAIVDVTERNKAVNQKLVFSTGDHLDTGRVSGAVQNLLTGENLIDATVGLYQGQVEQPLNDSLLSQQSYLYHTRTDETGAYKLENIKPGRYHLFAFKDNNKNARYDEPELIAYLPSMVTVNQSDTIVTLKSALLDTKPPIITNRQEQEGSLILKFSEGVRKMSFRVEQGRVANLYSLRRNQEDTRQIIIFGAPSAQAKRIVLAVQDSSGNERVDSLNIRFGGLSDISAKKIIRPVVEQGDEIDEWRVIFPTRMQVTKQQVATLADDTAQAVPGNELPVLPLSNTTMSVTIGVNANLDSTASILTIRPISRRGENGKKQLLRLDSTAIVPLDLPGRTITGQAIKLAAPVREEATGAITVKPQTSASSYALDLLRTDNSVVSRKGFWFNSAANGKQRLQPVTWDHLPPGKYRIRILVDTNNNGKWDGPDRSFTRLPEPVIFGPNVLEVRPNWEQEEIVAF